MSIVKRLGDKFTITLRKLFVTLSAGSQAQKKSISQDNKITAIMIKEPWKSTFKDTSKISEVPEDCGES